VRKLLDVAGARTARSAAGLFGFGSPRLGVNEKVEASARTESVQVFELERIVKVWAEVFMICAAPVEVL
jgi:hypothetical protein